MATMLWTRTSCVSLSETGEGLEVVGPVLGEAPGPQGLLTYKEARDRGHCPLGK